MLAKSSKLFWIFYVVRKIHFFGDSDKQKSHEICNFILCWAIPKLLVGIHMLIEGCTLTAWVLQAQTERDSPCHCFYDLWAKFFNQCLSHSLWLSPLCLLCAVNTSHIYQTYIKWFFKIYTHYFKLLKQTIEAFMKICWDDFQAPETCTSGPDTDLWHHLFQHVFKRSSA